jgi:uncharacterized membrane protein YfcA
VSRITTATGIHRREVTRLVAALREGAAQQAPPARSHASELFAHWRSQPPYLGPDGTPVVDVRDNRGAWWMLRFAGIYSGFVQAGVGFILLAALAGGLRYDLVRANALKMVCSLGSTLIALGVFLYFDMIRWVPGLVLAAGTMLGAWASVKFAVRAKQSTIKWFLFVMTLCSCVAALVF